jgi:Sel1 repeat
MLLHVLGHPVGFPQKFERIAMLFQTLHWRLGAAFCVAFFLPIALLGCVATDPALKSAIAEAEKNPTAARGKLRPFAQQGNERAIATLCVAYGRSIDSEVPSKERIEAFGWCSQAANAGVANAQYHLGRFYQSGIGVQEDKAQALRWFTAAAEQGHEDAETVRRATLGLPSLCKNWITNCKMF